MNLDKTVRKFTEPKVVSENLPEGQAGCFIRKEVEQFFWHLKEEEYVTRELLQ